MSRYVTVPTQTEKARNDQVLNSAGGFVFQLDCWKTLDRFLILGQEGPTYYSSERKIVREQTLNLQKCLQTDGLRTVRRIVEISDAGRAPKNAPAVFALALAAADSSPATRKAALDAIPRVCRTGTDFFSFVEDVQSLRGWGRGLRAAVGKWYTEKSHDKLALQLIKYRQRNGWTHRDVLRLAHSVPSDALQDKMLRFAAGKEYDIQHPMIEAFKVAQSSDHIKTIVKLIENFQLPWEALQTQHLNSPEVWEALLPSMGATALLRNLGKMTSVGLIKPLSNASKLISAKLTNEKFLKNGRVHPLKVLIAQKTYGQGHGDKGSLTWKPDQMITGYLEEAFYLAFDAVEPSGKNTLLALDVSGSMGSPISGAPTVSCAEASAVLAMVTARKEPNYHVFGFTGQFVPLGITAKDTLQSASQKVYRSNFGTTDCSLPMIYAQKNKLEVDVFHVYTDNETYMGAKHPFAAMRDYRKSSGRNAKLAVVGMTATDFSIADPTDPGMLDVVGFDANTPALLAQFARGDV